MAAICNPPPLACARNVGTCIERSHQGYHCLNNGPGLGAAHVCRHVTPRWGPRLVAGTGHPDFRGPVVTPQGFQQAGSCGSRVP